ncbi:MAG: hypothetical protein JO038_05040 [Alphaproteobacteria bacterium]|nr:hypothetical protein [Alphaproteobacteria bacterium]
MKRGLVIGMLAGFAAIAAAKAADPLPPFPDLLAGNTLSAVTFVPRPPGAPGGGALSRIMLQAYLRRDGSALVRVWDPGRDAYTVPVERRWTVSNRTLCLDLTNIGSTGPAPGIVCVDAHIWGPRIAGMGMHPYAMLDGDLQPGNRIGRR